MKSVHVVASLAPGDGGATTAVVETCKALSGMGESVSVISTDADGAGHLSLAEQARISAEVPFPVTWTRSHAPSQLKPSLEMFGALRAAVREADVVHIHALYLFHTWAAARAARSAGKPYVIQPHGGLDPYQQNHHAPRKRVYDLLVGRRALTGAAAVIFTDDSEALLAGSLVSKGKSALVPLGASVDELPPGSRPSFADWPDSANLVLFLGRVTQKKRPDLLLEAWRTVMRENADIQLVIAGPIDADLEVGLREQASGLKSVKFVGSVEGSDKAWLLRSAALFVLPSENENFAIALAEALRVGCPVVTTEAVALGTQVKDFGAGRVMREITAAELARLILECLEPAANEDFRCGAQKLGDLLTWERSAKSLLAVYQGL